MPANISTRKTEPSSSLLSRYAPVIERAPLPMVEVEGPNHVVCYVNAAFATLLNQRREQLLGQPFASIVCNGEKCVELLDRVYKTGECETHAEPDEETPAYWLYAMWPALNENAQPERVIIQLTRATDFRQNVAALNEALLVGGLKQHELREAAEQSNANLQLEIAQRRRVEAELQAVHATLRANEDRLERTVNERTLQLRTAMGELEAFAYSLAHDLRAPARAIHGFTQLALELPPGEIGPAAAPLLQRVIKAAGRMDNVIQDVLDLIRVIQRPMELAPVNLDTLVRQLTNERPELSPPRAEIAIESALAGVFGHEATLSQCLANLLSNAVKFVSPGVVPRVRIRTEQFEGPASGGRAGAAGPPWVRLWVEDNGIGISPEAQEQIFEIFHRLHSSAKYEGSGIGLAIVRKGSERMGGRVGVESVPGKGSRFWLELPKA